MPTLTVWDTRIEWKGAGCFFPDTMVHMEDGKLCEIQFLGPGDTVLSRSKETGELAYRKVVRNFEHDGKQVHTIDYFVAARPGHTYRLYATAEHPVWVETIGWTKACNLRSGHLLRLHDHTFAPVVEVNNLGDVGAVHNIEVEDFHTYFVDDSGVWVSDGVHQR
ncbi:Hint domain-containing protein [Massilia sp. TSP1-1-2]|uniref:Hint domain-containing protein n=1 Tax=unclassified Massilia TaxID=2609279 RepID=UPI003CF052BE